MREGGRAGAALVPLEELRESFADDEIDYFFELAFGTGSGRVILRKWTRDLRLGLTGEPTAADRQMVDRIAAELDGQLDGLRVRRVDRQPNVELYYGPPASFAQHEPNYRRGNRSFFWCWWNRSGEIERARILLPSIGVDQQTRDHLLARNLLRALGPMARSRRRSGGLFARAEDPRVLAPGELDRKVLAIHYHPDMPTGLTRERLRLLIGLAPAATPAAPPGGGSQR